MKPNQPTDTITKKMYASVGGLSVVGDYMTNTPQEEFAPNKQLESGDVADIATGVFQSNTPSMIKSALAKERESQTQITLNSPSSSIKIDSATPEIDLTGQSGVIKITTDAGSLLMDVNNHKIQMKYGQNTLTIDPAIHNFYYVQVTYNGVYSMMNVLGTPPVKITY